MKRRFTFLLAALLLMSGLTWAQTRTEEVTYTLDGTITGGSSGYATESEIIQNNITWMVTGNTTMNPWRIGGKNLTEVDRPLYSTGAISDNITKIEVVHGNASNITVNLWTVIVASDADFSTVISTLTPTFEANTTTTINRPSDTDWTGCYYKFIYNVSVSGNTNRFVQFVNAKFYKEADASAPTIAAENVEIEFNATSGDIEYTINNPVTGGNLTASTTSDWLTLGAVGTTVPFTCTANQTTAARTATVTLTYTYNTDQTATKNVTVTQAADPNAVNNISDITAAGTYAVRGTIVAKSERGFIVGDGTGYVYYYNTNYTQADYNIGDMVKLAGSVVVYGGVYEFNASTTITAATSSSYVAEDPTVLTGADMDARVASTTPPQLSNYVQYEGTLTVDNNHYNITDIVGATTAIGSISYPLDTEFTSLSGKHVKVTGYYVGISTSTYYNTMLGSIEEVATSDPLITAEDVSIEYDATSGAIAYTIDNPVDGGVLTAATEDEWLTLGTVGTTVPFTCEANTTASARTATVTLTYTYNTDQFVTKNVTVTQAGNPSTIDNISDITAAGTYTVQGTIVAISNRGFIVGDGTGYVYYYYGSSGFESGDYDIGDNVKLSGSVVAYGGVFEFNNSTIITFVDESNYVEEDPTVLTGAEMDARVASTTPAQLSSYVQYEGTLTVSGNYYNITNIAGAQTAKGSISFPLETEFASLNGKQVKVTGYYVGVSSSQYYNTMIGSVEEVVSTEPSITVAPASVDVPAEGADGTFAITYANIPDLISFDYYFCDANGDELEDTDPDYPDWIYAEITEPTGNEGYVVSYIIDANDGEARNAYFKVYTIVGDREAVFSNLVTINQEAYVAPSIAELPFAFDGGKAAIDTIDGLTQNGLGGDYGSSPKLKFDGTGDWLLLQFDEVPGALTFDIKGNGFSGGTFTVQTSEDGVTYTDLETYTELGATQSELFDNLGENVRYIKWIYTEKVSGNVALGNIVLYEEGGGPVIDTYDLTVEPFENLEIFTFVGGDETQAALDGAGTIQVAEGDQVMLSVTANEGYILQSLMVDGVEHVNDITEEETYTFTMPGHNVTISATAVEDVPPTPFEPATYTLATTIESGKTYIIVGSKTTADTTLYFAMGEQRNNNRGGVAISVDGNTATVETADVYEFVITALEENGFYSIYDDRTPGYLYAAAPGSNYLRTEPELDTLHNGDWEISINDTTGWFNVVASQSNNRNVMQFNGGSTIFSCYGSASQSPVYLYVKDETPSTVTQTIALANGYNWVSFDVEITLNDLKAALLEAAPNTVIQINGKDNATTYNPNNHRWLGNLTWDVANMYKIKVTSDCEITVEGMPIDPAEHPVTIVNGANWIAFPLSQSMTLTDAFAGFAVQGDQVLGKDGSALYNRGRWQGTTLPALEPGQGYIYKSAATGSRTLVFPSN